MSLRFFVFLTVPVLGLVCLTMLYHRSRERELIRDSFERHWVGRPLNLKQEIILAQRFRNIERSLTSDCLYLTNPQLGLIGELCLTSIPSHFNMVEGVTLASEVMASTFQHPSFLWVSHTGEICQYNITTKNYDTLGVVKLPVDKIYAVGSKSVLLVGVSSNLKRFVVGQLRDTHVSWNADILGEHHDGIFSLDGNFVVNKNSNKIIYAFYYHNRILAFDTLMERQYVAQTIDSVSTFQMKIASHERGIHQTLASPRMITNAHLDTYESHLVVQSHVMGVKETEAEFRNSYIFDCYALVDGRYRMSFSIPKAGTSTIRSFKLTGTHLVVLHADRIRMFEIPDEMR